MFTVTVVALCVSPRNTASEVVKTLMAYGYNLEPPTNEGQEGKMSGSDNVKAGCHIKGLYLQCHW